ncbi:unnamed protein product [Schistosoma mattheei]|uniref:Uncharacterized protein n=1 Tax=Schistosoma mattheei TaxID=31246 RepID=A0A183Q546_9TREM|nr:unnamed protein product [Schistosoma mattheei]
MFSTTNIKYYHLYTILFTNELPSGQRHTKRSFDSLIISMFSFVVIKSKHVALFKHNDELAAHGLIRFSQCKPVHPGKQ